MVSNSLLLFCLNKSNSSHTNDAVVVTELFTDTADATFEIAVFILHSSSARGLGTKVLLP